MSLAQNKELDRLIIEEAWGKGNIALLDGVCDPSCVLHDAQLLEGVEAIKEHIARNHRAFPDMSITIESQVAEADSVVTVFTFAGTHLGDLGPLSATGKPVRVTGIFISRYIKGRYTEGRSYFDRLAMMQQLSLFV